LLIVDATKMDIVRRTKLPRQSKLPRGQSNTQQRTSSTWET
jgi:hypothetical protein